MSEDRRLPDDPETRELRARFLSSLGALRPKLHRFCALMCGSVLDGEDLVQETLAAASFKVSRANPGFLDPSLFQMAWKRCLYFIERDLGGRERTVVRGGYPDRVVGPQQSGAQARPRELLVGRLGVLHPYDRAVIVLIDLLGYSVLDTAELIGTTVGHVKIVLLSARATIRQLPPLGPSAAMLPGHLAVMRTFADSFNRLDGAGLHRLVHPDARVEIVGAFSGRFGEVDAMYAGTYASIPWEWSLSVALVDGDPALVASRRVGTQWEPYSAILVWWEKNRAVRIRDYMHIRYILRDARIEH